MKKLKEAIANAKTESDVTSVLVKSLGTAVKDINVAIKALKSVKSPKPTVMIKDLEQALEIIMDVGKTAASPDF